jgi:hypothetical protein
MTKVNKEVADMMNADDAAKKQQASLDTKRRPLKTFSIGDVRVAVWARDVKTKTGEDLRFYSIQPQRVYHDRKGTPCYAGSFNLDELGALMSCLKDAGDFVNNLRGLVPVTDQD